MNARQFFDVFSVVVEQVHEQLMRNATNSAALLHMAVFILHGPKVADEAMQHYQRLLEAAKTGDRP